MRLITISAKARCGKDTAAQYLLSRYPRSTAYALAACFKESISNHFSEYLTYDDVFGYGVDRNSYLIYIDREEFIDLTKKVFADFGYNLDEFSDDGECIDIDWSVINDDNGWTIRRMMQTIGTDIGVNQIDTNIWLKEFEKELFKIEPIYDTVVMTDCRQIHEIEFIRNRNGHVLHVLRDTGLDDDHITERGLPIEDEDFVIENDGTLDDFYRKLDQFIQQLP
jgi:hypothetical protein